MTLERPYLIDETDDTDDDLSNLKFARIRL